MRLSETDRRSPVWALPLMAAAAVASVLLLGDPVPVVDQARGQASGVERLTVAGPLGLRLSGECPWAAQVHG